MENDTSKWPEIYVIPQMEKLEKDFPERVVFIGIQLAPPLREKLIVILWDHQDCFAWSFIDMTEIDPSIIIHRLQVDPSFTPIKQKRRKFALVRDTIIEEYVQKLPQNGLIREVCYPKWKWKKIGCSATSQT